VKKRTFFSARVAKLCEVLAKGEGRQRPLYVKLRGFSPFGRGGKRGCRRCGLSRVAQAGKKGKRLQGAKVSH